VRGLELDLERLTAEQVLAHVIERNERVAIACSFQKEASVIMHMATQISRDVSFFTLDTGLHFQETYDTWRALEERYEVKVEGLRGIPLHEQRALHGDKLWETDPDLCCSIRKVVPMRERLANADVWIAGLRRDQSAERAGTPKLHWDDKHGLWKANPLADWSEREVWTYIFRHDIPYNLLHDRDFESIGCEPCTTPGAGRAGRWAGTDKVECGLHAA
jgi:phosphoadenosine phosphosulfate reductase